VETIDGGGVMKKKKKCRHNIETEEECSNCGYQEGFCSKCKSSFCRIGFKRGVKWEEL